MSWWFLLLAPLALAGPRKGRHVAEEAAPVPESAPEAIAPEPSAVPPVPSLPAGPQVGGSLTLEDAERVVAARMDWLLACYTDQLGTGDPPGSGTVLVEAVVDDRGTVVSSNVQTSTLGHAEVERCLIGRFWQLRFAPLPEGSIGMLSWPMRLPPGE